MANVSGRKCGSRSRVKINFGDISIEMEDNKSYDEMASKAIEFLRELVPMRVGCEQVFDDGDDEDIEGSEPPQRVKDAMKAVMAGYQ